MGRNSRIKRERRSSRRRVGKEKQEARARLAATILSRSTVAEVRRAVLDAGAIKESCILSTRLYVDLAQSMGFRCAEVVVETCAMNPVASIVLGREAEEHGADVFSEGSPALEDLRERGGHVVVLGQIDEDQEPRPGFWVGHLVALLEDHEGQLHLIDVSLDQASRPKKCMLLRPTAFPVPEEFVDGVKVARLAMDTPDGKCFIDYRARPNEMGYLRNPDWGRRFNARLTTDGEGNPHVTVMELNRGGSK